MRIAKSTSSLLPETTIYAENSSIYSIQNCVHRHNNKKYTSTLKQIILCSAQNVIVILF